MVTRDNSSSSFGSNDYWFGRFATLLILACALTASVQARTGDQSGTIRGRVSAETVDKREPLVGAVVTLSGEVLRGKSIQTVSVDDGSYSFTGLVSGTYTVTVEFQGFAKFEERVMVAIDSTVDLNIRLKPAGIKETVDVAPDQDEVAKNESTVPSQVTSQTLRNAPLVNDKFQDALPLLPGVVRAPDGTIAYGC
jgi:hypothetical protein